MPNLRRKPPDGIRPYLFHGVSLQQGEDGQAVGDCPFCDREGKFSVEVATSKFKCWSCSEHGNSLVFIRRLWEQSEKQTGTANYKRLAAERRFLNLDTVLQWGITRSVVSGNWLVPGYGANGALNQLYQYMETKKGMRLLPTPTLGHQLHGVNLYKLSKPVVYLCEGPWDGMALWEVLRQCKRNDDGNLVVTASHDNCLYAEASVLAVPGCSTFKDEWTGLFAKKTVNLMYDNDHPQTKTDTKLPPGMRGMRRVARILNGAKIPPNEICYLAWGNRGFDPELPNGADVRDLLST